MMIEKLLERKNMLEKEIFYLTCVDNVDEIHFRQSHVELKNVEYQIEEFKKKNIINSFFNYDF